MTETSAISIRAAEPEDVAAYTRIHGLPEVMQETSQPPYMAVSEQARRVTNTPNERILVAEWDGTIAGFASLTLYAGRRAHAASFGIAVDPEFAGRGIGSELLSAIIDLGEQWYGIKRLELKVLVENERAIRLYKRFGFEIEATHRQYAQRAGRYVDAYTMARLSP